MTAPDPELLKRYQEHLHTAELAYQAGDYDASVRAACRALEVLPGEESPTHLVAASQAALRAGSGVRVQPAPVFFTNLQLFQLQQQGHVFPGSVCAAAGNFLYALVRLLAPRLVVETGTLFGFSCLCMGQALKDNGENGRLIAFDLFPDSNYHDLQPGQTGYDYVAGIITSAGLSDTITLHQGNSAEAINAFFADQATPPDLSTPIDLAFIDGDHFIRGCVNDFLAVDKHLKPGAIIILHDTDPQASGWVGPRFLVERLRETATDATYEVMNLPTTDRLGMALLKKQGDLPEQNWQPSITQLATEWLLHRKHFGRR